MRLPDSSKHLIRVWIAHARASIVREMEFRGNFIAGIIRQALWLGIFIFLVEIIFHNTTHLGGWGREEVLVIIGLSRIIEGIMNMIFTGNIMEFPGQVREGMFDFHMTKPLPLLPYTSLRRMNIDNAGNILVGIFLFIYSVYAGALSISIPALVAFPILVISGILIYYSILIMFASLVFVLERLEFLWALNMLISEPLTMPFDIFPAVPRTVITYLIPLAFVVFVPAQAVTGRLEARFAYLAVCLAVLFLFLANLCWKAGVKRYSSASS